MSKIIPKICAFSPCPDGEKILYGKKELIKSLEYIQTTGTQCIDTGFKGNQDTTIALKASVQKVGCLFAAGANWRNSETGFWTNQFNLMAEYGSVNKAIPSVARTVHTYKWEKDSFWIDAELKWTAGNRKFKHATSFTISCTNRTAGAGEFSSLTIYECKIYDNDILVRDMIPVKHSTLGVGMWDKVEKKFYGNAGSGEFVPGKEVGLIGS